MRKSLLPTLLTLLTLSVSITAEAAAFERTSHAEIAEHDNQHHKKRHKKDRHKKPPHHPGHRPKGIVVHHGHTPYIYSGGRYYRERGGAYIAVRPARGLMVPTLPKGYVIIKKKKGEIRYSYRGVVYERISHKGRLMFKVVGFM